MAETLNTAELATELANLQRANAVESAISAGASLDEPIRKWLDNVRGIGRRFDARDFTISVQVPFGLSASFTWASGGPKQ